MVKRIGDWFESYLGKQIWVLDPRPDDFSLGDIVQALPNICRFNGHIERHYSVAEHSIRVYVGVSDEIERWKIPFSEYKDLCKTALLHDASEAFLCDIVKPFKMMDEMEFYREIEARWEKCLAEKFGLIYPFPEVIHVHDSRALATEIRDLRPHHNGINWKCKPQSPYEVIIPKGEALPSEIRKHFADMLTDFGLHV